MNFAVLIRNSHFSRYKLLRNQIFVRCYWYQLCKSSPVSTFITVDNLNRMKNSTSSISFKNQMFSNLKMKFVHLNNYDEILQGKRTLTTVNDGQQSILILKEVLDLQNKKISNWIVENKIKKLCSFYKFLQKEHKETFLRQLATKYAVDHLSVSKVAHQVTELEVGSGKMLKVEEKLKNQLAPKYTWLFKNIGRLEMGVKFLVDLRTDVMDLLPTLDPKSAEYIDVQQLNIALRELLTVWFSVGFLNLERITWQSPCSMLEKIAEYEAVHPVRNWVDLKRRVGPYRRCFVYTHSSMPEEPLVVLHVALTQDIVSSMRGLTTPLPTTDDVVSVRHGQTLNQRNEDPQLVKAFIFYSISSSQRGLQGIELGNYLIKRAAKELLSEYPQADMFSSLSPIPTFRIWLIERIKLAEKGEHTFAAGLWDNVLRYLSPGSEELNWSELRKTIVSNTWHQNPRLTSLMENPLMVCCSRYLYQEKRRGYAYDSVANFHLRNGAVMWRLNWLADITTRGLSNSCGLMVNYRYYLDEAEANSLNYVEDQQIKASQQIVRLAKDFNSKL